MRIPAFTALRRARISGALATVLVLAAAAPGSAQQQGQRITPNFRDADITQLIDLVSQATGRNFIIAPGVHAQVTWLSGPGTTMTPEQFYQGFLSVLQVHGLVAVPSGSVIKVLPDTNMRQYPSDDLPGRVSSSSDELVTQVISLSNVSAQQLVPVLRPLMPQTAQLQAVTGANMLVMSDRAANINRMMRIIARIDQNNNSDIDVVPLQNATAADTVRVLNSLVSQGGGEAGGGPNLRLVADDRSNSILMSGDPALKLRIRALIANLDTPLDTGGETVVRYLNYAKAEDLATKLKEQISANANAGAGGSRPAGAPPNNAAGAATVSLAGGTGTIWADKDTNALIITAPPRTMRALNAVIDKLDIRRAQVHVDAIIVEVSADKTSDLGVNWILDGSNSKMAVGGFIEPIGGVSAIDLYGLAKGTTTDLSKATGSNFAIGRLQATGVNFGAIVRALQGDSRTNIISQPSITMRDNEESKLEVAQEVPFITGQYTSTAGAGSAFQTVQRQQVGTILTVTPQINEGDAVILSVEVESSSLAASSAGAVDLITNKRTIKTSVLIPDGGTLVIGGLMQDKAINSEQRVPWLGRIPLLGELFRTRDTSKTKTNLMVFLQPHILRDDRGAALETNSKYDTVRREQRDLERENTLLPLQPFQKLDKMPDFIQPPAKAPPPAAPSTAPATTPAAPPPTAPAATPDASAPAQGGAATGSQP
ncbi:MAG TPA: type II secretion system secretin GspD [Steroidobacteraceae bacterium]|nr:type II secretion system secretin GspD [Steroidobacteraceae bacterium]